MLPHGHDYAYYAELFSDNKVLHSGKVQNINLEEFTTAWDDLYLFKPFVVIDYMRKKYIIDYILAYRGATHLDDQCNYYLDQVTSKHQVELSLLETKDNLFSWINEAFCEALEDNRLERAKVLSLDKIRKYAIYLLKTILIDNVSAQYNLLTSWRLANTRNSVTERLFGPAVKELPVIISNCSSGYVTYCTEDYACGMRVFLRKVPECSMLMNCKSSSQNDTFINVKSMLPDDYTIRNDRAQCSIIVNNEKYYFETYDFVRGLIDGAAYVGRDPQKIIRSYYFYPLNKEIDIEL